jgi:hypothetical protein
VTASPVEVWLRQRNLAVKGLIVQEDESTEDFATFSLNMRGAQREVTTRMRTEGYVPVGRWETTASSHAVIETTRRFR